VELASPVEYEGKRITTIALDFSKVSGEMVNWCENKTFGTGNMTKILPQFSSEYCSRLASCISDLPYPKNWDARYRIVEKLNYTDFDTVWQTMSAYIQKRNPQKFYDQFVEPDYDEAADSYGVGDEDAEGFTEPQEAAESSTLIF
jgi:hypothetical protein